MNKEQFWERSRLDCDQDEASRLRTGKGVEEALQNADELHLQTLREKCISARIYYQLLDRSLN